MTLEVGVIALVLLAAVLHASWNALVKVSGDRLVMLALMHIAPGLLAWGAIPFVPAPEPASWPFLLASTAIHVAYFYALIYAYSHGDLSQVYPIARGTAPMLVALGAWIFAGERLSLLEIAGVVVVSAGIISLAQRRGKRSDGESAAIFFALMTSLTIAGYSVADGMGVRRAGSQLSYILWLFALDSLPILGFAIWRRRADLRAAFLPQLKIGIAGGMLTAAAYGIVIWAMSLAPMAHIIALRETSVVIAAMIGTLVLKEPFGRHRIAAAAVVASGAVLLNVSG